MQPRLLQLRRLVIGEAGRFPQLGHTSTSEARGARSPRWPPPSSAWPQRGLLDLDDPQLAAAHFNWLVMSIPLNQAMFLGDDDLPERPTSTATRTPACVSSSPPTADAEPTVVFLDEQS